MTDSSDAPFDEPLDYPRYLTAKAAVDEQALSPRVWQPFVDWLRGHASEKPLRIADMGGGIGFTLLRVLAAVERPLTYFLVDASAANLARARSNLRNWAQERGFATEAHDTPITIRRPSGHATVHFCRGDAMTWRPPDGAPIHALASQALLDLLPLDRTLQHWRSLLLSDHRCYLALLFDGATVFEPPGGSLAIQQPIIDAYHRSMEARRVEGAPTGGAYCGRRVVRWLYKNNAQLFTVDSSDWSILGSTYDPLSDNESLFVQVIASFVKSEGRASEKVSSDIVNEWYDKIIDSITSDQIYFRASHLDILAALKK
ncbi:class I SAM-dependent methyltransferase [Salisaeta longa]|uniref:SAM-dependent methyltransferase n=1 Tax=Salisaeta longa TaxID=503170 RepID=UPI0003B568F4|nr:SAM-dependent methyltransferase [Salisaeta longa]